MDMFKGSANKTPIKEKPGWTINFMPELEEK